jgi:UDP-N-acetylmuramoyl-tripeptide--D-alanyl-D-alanine ligase
MRIKLSIPQRMDRIAEFTKGVCLNNSTLFINHISTDSKEINKGDLFIALKGDKYDGHDFCDEVTAKGGFTMSENPTSTTVLVNSTKDALLLFAAKYKKMLPSLRSTVAVTGSVGKTTTKNFINSILSKSFHTHKTKNNYNNHIGAPLTVLSADKHTEILITELGMNHSGELSALSYAIEPDVAVITKIGTSHLGNFGSREMIAAAKSEIADAPSVKSVIIPYGEKLLSSVRCKKSFAFTASGSRITVSDYSLSLIETDKKGSRASFRSGNESFDLYFPVPGIHNLECLGFAISAAREVGMSCDDIKDAIDSVTCWEISGKYIDIFDFKIYNDSYNSSYESVKAALDMLTVNKSTSVSAALGDIYELGASTEEVHRDIGYIAAKKGIRSLYLYGVYAGFIRDGAILGGLDKSRIFVNTDLTDPVSTAEQILTDRKKGETVLFKASNAVKMYEIINVLKAMENKENDR